MFIIEDEWHAEQVAAFESKEEALAELRRLEALPWDAEPNRAPCTSWQTCGRRYELVEYDSGSMPWRELGREPVLEVSRKGAKRIA